MTFKGFVAAISSYEADSEVLFEQNDTKIH